MKIMSLNVGKFFPLGLLEGSKIKEIIACIQTFLFSDISGVVFLQEVPEDFIDELEKILNGGDKAIFDIIRPEPDPPRQVNGYTLAIKNRKGDWKPVKVGFKEYKKDIEENTSDDEFTDRYKKNGEKYEWFYENKFIEIKSNTLDLQILGVHAPWTKGQNEPPKTSNTVFWKALEGYAKTKKRLIPD